MKNTILITGGAGFIGSHVVRLFVKKNKNSRILNIDALTYAGNLENLKDVEKSKNYKFEKVDIANKKTLEEIFSNYEPTAIIHLAAESHVDRSIFSPNDFVRTNVIGTVNLLNAARKCWKKKNVLNKFIHVSTDEVYGSLRRIGSFNEKTPYAPNSPYAASKAASDHFVRAYNKTYGIPAVITNCSNNYGPNQFPEKLIPLFINNILRRKKLPIYGLGLNTRDWVYVKDHARALELVFKKGKIGETYVIGGFNKFKNNVVVRKLCYLMDEKLGYPVGTSEKLISYVEDRFGHDERYAVDSSKIQNKLGWKPKYSFTRGLRETIDWYFENREWLDDVTSGKYKKYYRRQYYKK